MRSIRRRLTLGLLAALALLLLAGGAALHLAVRARLLADFDEALHAKARALATLVEQERDGRLEFEFAGEIMPEFERGGSPELFQIWHPGGETLERSPSLGGAEIALPATPWDDRVAWDLMLPGGPRGRALAIRFAPPREDGGPGTARVTLAVARSREPLDATLTVFLGAITAAALVLAGSAALVVWLGVRRGLRPLDRVAAEAQRLTPEDLSHRFAVDALPAELRPVCARLNDAFARVEAALARERRFTADAAHELRTPLAELRTAAEVALRWRDDPALAERGLRTAHDVSLQMERLVTALLELRRAQMPPATAPEALDLAALVREAWEPHAARAAERALRVTFALPETAPIESDRALLRGILANLASNAAEHAVEGGEVTWRIAGPSRRLAVTNRCTGLTAGDLPHLAEPFWRRDPARTDGTHSGLGLTLAQAFAGHLGARLRFALPAADLFEATLTLEAPGAPSHSPTSIATSASRSS